MPSPGFRLFPPGQLVCRPHREHHLLGSSPLPASWTLASSCYTRFHVDPSLSLETTGPNHREWGPGLREPEPAQPGSKKKQEGPGPPSKLSADFLQSCPPSLCPLGDYYWRQRGLQACMRMAGRDAGAATGFSTN